MRRTIEYHASRRHDSEPTSYRIALPYVVFVVSTYGEQIESLSTYFRTAPLRSLDDQLYSSTLPNTNDDGIVCLGSVRVSGATVGERVDALIGAFWASRFNQDLRRHPARRARALREVECRKGAPHAVAHVPAHRRRSGESDQRGHRP